MLVQMLLFLQSPGISSLVFDVEKEDFWAIPNALYIVWAPIEYVGKSEGTSRIQTDKPISKGELMIN